MFQYQGDDFLDTVNPKAPIPLEFLNTVVQLSFDFAVVYFLGKFLRCNVWQLLGL